MAEERISNIRTVKSFSQENMEIQRYADKMQNVFEIAKKEAWARGIFYGLVSVRITYIGIFCIISF